MEKRMLLALAISFIIFAGFGYIQQRYMTPPPPPQEAKPEEQAAVAKPTPSLSPMAPAPALPPPPIREQQSKEVIVDTPLYRAVFTQQGARLQSFRLKKFWDHLPFTQVANFNLWLFSIDIQKYKKVGSEITAPKELVHTGSPDLLPLTLVWNAASGSVGSEAFYTASQEKLTLAAGDEAQLTFTTVQPDGVTLVKTYTFKGNSYQLDLTATVQNQGGRSLQGNLSLALSDNFSKPQDYGFLGFIWSANKSRDEIASAGLKEPKMISELDWAALSTGYFMMAMVPPPAEFKTTAMVRDLPGKMMTATLETPVAALPPGQELAIPYTLYFGPKDRSILAPLGFGLEKAVDFGWFQILALPLLYVLKIFYNFLHNYGLAIVVLTFLIRVLFIYPNHKSFKSMQDMQKLQPKIAKLREKYKDEREALNKELMGLYRTYKVNPLGGCLPMLLQLPVFIALYNILGYAIELRHAPFISTLPFTDIVWLADLSAKDPLLITPIIMGATMFVQQKMTPTPGDPAQAKLMLFLPIIFTFFFLNFASGLVLYWLLNNVLAIIQQYYTNKYLS
ncbi:MAG: membrane protein insertase YidC [Deltaproteobacteria bacterium]|nr:membrane protein insertase YidC [Deltaproteobacteria bacterium]